MATEPSARRVVPRLSADALTLEQASSDLLTVQPIDLGPGEPGTAALELERGPQPAAAPDSGTQ